MPKKLAAEKTAAHRKITRRSKAAKTGMIRAESPPN